jgi:hypothetical protein
MSVIPVHVEAVRFFQTVLAPRAVKPVAIAVCLAETIRIALSTLNAPDKLCHIQVILFQIQVLSRLLINVDYFFVRNRFSTLLKRRQY